MLLGIDSGQIVIIHRQILARWFNINITFLPNEEKDLAKICNSEKVYWRGLPGEWNLFFKNGVTIISKSYM